MHTTAAAARDLAQYPKRATGYIRVSSAAQKQGYSPEVQRDRIIAFAGSDGFDLVTIEEDVQRGRVVTREGYQRILDAANRGKIDAVIVQFFDRWGRNGAEWIARAAELERLGIEFISITEGREEGGFMRYYRGFQAEDYVKQLARKIQPAREASARAGHHMGRAPWGYRRVYPEHQPGMRRPAGSLIICTDLQPWIVGLFERAATGQYSDRALARWLNTVPDAPASPRGCPWDKQTVRYILQNPVYAGLIRFNRRPSGFYERAAPGTEFVKPGLHPAMISRELFENANRHRAPNGGPQRKGSNTRPILFAEGILRCHGCGGPVTVSASTTNAVADWRYSCLGRRMGRTACTASDVLTKVAHAAIADQLARLRLAPWDAERLRARVELGDQAVEIAATEAALREQEDALQEHMHDWAMRKGPRGEAERRMHHKVCDAFNGEIERLEAQLTELRKAPATEAQFKAVYDEAIALDLPGTVAAIAASGDYDALRDLALKLIDSAAITERVPTERARWARAALVWSERANLLFEAGLIAIAPDTAQPPAVSARTLRRRQLHAERRALREADDMSVAHTEA